jgi:hypothetical protein
LKAWLSAGYIRGIGVSHVAPDFGVGVQFSIVARRLFLAAGLIGAAVMPASAVPVETFTFDDHTESPTILEGAFSSPCNQEICDLGVGGTNDPIVSGPSPVNLNILDRNGSTLSDFLELTVAGGTLFMHFVSDPEPSGFVPGFTGLGPPSTSTIENGQVQTVATYFTLSGTEIVVNFRSDIDSAPEPSSLLLLVGGLMAYALFFLCEQSSKRSSA